MIDSSLFLNTWNATLQFCSLKNFERNFIEPNIKLDGWVGQASLMVVLIGWQDGRSGMMAGWVKLAKMTGMGGVDGMAWMD